MASKTPDTVGPSIERDNENTPSDEDAADVEQEVEQVEPVAARRYNRREFMIATGAAVAAVGMTGAVSAGGGSTVDWTSSFAPDPRINATITVEDVESDYSQ
jgi:hypothetical protein